MFCESIFDGVLNNSLPYDFFDVLMDLWSYTWLGLFTKFYGKLCGKYIWENVSSNKWTRLRQFLNHKIVNHYEKEEKISTQKCQTQEK